MTAANFPPSLAIIKAYEGGFSDNTRDPGGATDQGVTLETLQDYLGRTCTIDELRMLPLTTIEAIYRAKFWDAVKGDPLPSGLDLMCFDGAVQHGPDRMAKMLQSALNVTPDGDIGPETLRAIGCVSLVTLIQKLQTRRFALYRLLPNFPVFGVGWTRRLTSVAATATSWASKVESVA